MKILLALALLILSALLAGCSGGDGAASTTQDATAAAASIDASKKGIVAQPDSDLNTGGGTAAKPGKH